MGGSLFSTWSLVKALLGLQLKLPLAEALTKEKFSSCNLWYPAARIVIFLIQEYYHLLQERVVAYINVDIAVSGFYLFLFIFFLFLKEDSVFVSLKSDFARTFFMYPSVCHISPKIKSSFGFPLRRKPVELQKTMFCSETFNETQCEIS